jgi:hypothetical protein
MTLEPLLADQRRKTASRTIFAASVRKHSVVTRNCHTGMSATPEMLLRVLQRRLYGRKHTKETQLGGASFQSGGLWTYQFHWDRVPIVKTCSWLQY